VAFSIPDRNAGHGRRFPADPEKYGDSGLKLVGEKKKSCLRFQRWLEAPAFRWMAVPQPALERKRGNS